MALHPGIRPSLLDRLIGHMARKSTASASGELPAYVPDLERFDERAMRLTLVRDVSWLFNDISFDQVTDLSAYPEVQVSVLNFGISDMASDTINPKSLAIRADGLVARLKDFEPRIEKDTLRIDADSEANVKDNKIQFVLTGVISMSLDDREFVVSTRIDLDHGRIEVAE